MTTKTEAFCCWSGGKESSLALYRAIQDPGIEVSRLLNMVSEDGECSRSHGLPSNLLRLQAEAMGIRITQRKTSRKTYEQEFRTACSEFTKESIEVGVFGDIDVQEHRDWIERVCGELGVSPILPLWKRKREELLAELIRDGFKTIVVAVDTSVLDERWLGCHIDEHFMGEIKGLGIDPCGEKGEYHTFVYDGPMFKHAVDFTVQHKTLEGKNCFLGLVA